jgi:hypothetical protein
MLRPRYPRDPLSYPLFYASPFTAVGAFWAPSAAQDAPPSEVPFGYRQPRQGFKLLPKQRFTLAAPNLLTLTYYSPPLLIRRQETLSFAPLLFVQLCTTVSLASRAAPPRPACLLCYPSSSRAFRLPVSNHSPLPSITRDPFLWSVQAGR